MEKLDKNELENFRTMINKDYKDTRNCGLLAHYVAKFVYRIEDIIFILRLANIGPENIALQGRALTVWGEVVNYTVRYSGKADKLIDAITEYAEMRNLAGWLDIQAENEYTAAEWAAIQRWVNR